jgi:hypothetical protein
MSSRAELRRWGSVLVGCSSRLAMHGASAHRRAHRRQAVSFLESSSEKDGRVASCSCGVQPFRRLNICDAWACRVVE